MKDTLYTAEMIENAAMSGDMIVVNGRSFSITEAAAAPAPAPSPAPSSATASIF